MRNSSNHSDDGIVDAAGARRIPSAPRISVQAFSESQDISQIVAAAAADRRMAKAQVKLNMGGAIAAVEAFREAPTPNVIMIEAPSDRNTLIAKLDELSHYCDHGTKVVVLGKVNDIVLYRQLVARGVSDYLVAPFGPLDLVESIANLFHGPDAKPLGRTLAVIGAKGGAGASTIAHNLAWKIAESGSSAVIADFDLAFGTAGLDFNQDPPQGVADVLNSPDRVDATLVERLLSKCGENLSLLAAPATLDKTFEFQDTSFDGVIDAMKPNTPWIVLDLPHIWAPWTRRLLLTSDEVVIVAQPDLASLRNAKNLIDGVKGGRPNDHPPRLVINNFGAPKRPEITVADFEKAVDCSPIAVIPHDAKLFGSASNNGQMIGEIEPNGKIAEIFAALADVVQGRGEVRKPKRGFLEPLMAKLGRKSA